MSSQTIDATSPLDGGKTPKKGKSPKNKKNGRGAFLWLWFKRLFVLGLVLGILALLFVTVYVIRATKDLPSVESLKQYSPAVMSRVHAGDGKLIAEYGIEKRVFVPIHSIPKQIQHALVSSEDQRFYIHNGFDLKGFSRAMLANVKHVLKGERLEGGSTLTQQVAKHFLVGNERKIDRKIREVFIARRIEKAMSKDKILELYLNDVYFGRRAYGIAGASLNYFNKPLDGLSLGQKAYLAGLVKGPNNYQPNKNMDKAINRRNYVLSRMELDGYITADQAVAAKAETLELKSRLFGADYLAAEYFVAEVRKQINTLYGEKQLNEGGLSIRTTLDTKMQLAARKALRRGLGMYDRRHGYRGALGQLTMDEDGTAFDASADWKPVLKSYKAPSDIKPWRKAVVLAVADKQVKLGFVDGDDGTLALADMVWAKKALPNGGFGNEIETLLAVFSVGEVILVEAKKQGSSQYNLRQVPNANGGIIAMDPHTGRVLALVGGYSFTQSQFNRVTQAYRQPGSSFKPFVYAAALDNGFTPASQILDAPFVIEHNDREEGCEALQDQGLASVRFGRADEDGQTKEKPPAPVEDEFLENIGEEEEEKECGPRFYKPANFNAGKFYGLSTLRLGLEKSRNAMTVRLANDIGMTAISRYGRAFGIYDETKPELAWSLGAGETTLIRMASAYATLVNGGKKVVPTLLDRVQDNTGKTVYLHDKRACPECAQANWDETATVRIMPNGQEAVEYFRPAPPTIPDERETVVSPVTAYQITSMLEGAVQRGTGRQMLRLERPLAGKTGTTNDFKDAWFMGFSPDLVTGVYVGYDQPQSLGTETGAKAAGPIWRFFMGDALKDKPKVSFRIPQGVSLAPVDQITGEPSFIGAQGFIYEAFKPGTEPQLGGSRKKIRIGGGSIEQDKGYDYGFDGADASGFSNNDNETSDNLNREILDYEELGVIDDSLEEVAETKKPQNASEADDGEVETETGDSEKAKPEDAEKTKKTKADSKNKTQKKLAVDAEDASPEESEEAAVTEADDDGDAAKPDDVKEATDAEEAKPETQQKDTPKVDKSEPEVAELETPEPIISAPIEGIAEDAVEDTAPKPQPQPTHGLETQEDEEEDVDLDNGLY